MGEGSEALRVQGRKSPRGGEHLSSLFPPNLLIVEDKKSKRRPFVMGETKTLILLTVTEEASSYLPHL